MVWDWGCVQPMLFMLCNTSVAYGGVDAPCRGCNSLGHGCTGPWTRRSFLGQGRFWRTLQIDNPKAWGTYPETSPHLSRQPLSQAVAEVFDLDAWRWRDKHVSLSSKQWSTEWSRTAVRNSRQFRVRNSNFPQPHPPSPLALSPGFNSPFCHSACKASMGELVRTSLPACDVAFSSFA